MDNNGDSAANPPTLPCTGTNYALDGKIMLSTVVLLFLAIFLILGFHSYARCFFHRRLRGHRRRLHRQQLFRPTPLAPPTSVVAGGGLDASVLKSLPIFTFHYSKSDASFECAVCLSEIEEGEKGRRLSKCDHVFHVDCIDAWFESHANCPLCRATVPANKVSQAENAAGVERATATADGAWSIGTSDCEIGGCSTSSSSSACSSTPPPASCPKAVEIEGITVESSPAAMEDRVEELQKIGSTGRDRSKSPGDRILGLKRILSI